MDFVKNLTGGGKEGEQQGQQQTSSGGGSFADKLNSMAGGGAAGEKKEDALDKGKPPFLLSLHQCRSEWFASGSNAVRERYRLGPAERHGTR